MNYYRISKYNSEYRKNNIYTIDEWTAYSDIGKIYNGKEFDYPEYMKIESNYIEMLVHIFKLLKIDKLKILCLEKYEENLDWQDNEILNNEKAITFAADCLREKCWGKLYSNEFIWKTGYDFYMYLACELTLKQITEISKKYNLFVEKFKYDND
ncbi:MAG: hypothetical protein IJW76_07460 [Clostridia bacterium]|nr:hypothetical protein [Clostridia bacterium]